MSFNNLNIFKEEIFKREETLIIDEEFNKIIKKISEPEFKTKLIKKQINPDLYFEKNIRNIEKQIKILFNGTIILRFDDNSNFKALSFGMCIFPSTAEMHGKIKDALERNKEGFHLYDCNNSLILIDYCMIFICEKYKLGGRGLTAVLLHELGHKIYCKTQDDILNVNVCGFHFSVKNNFDKQSNFIGSGILILYCIFIKFLLRTLSTSNLSKKLGYEASGNVYVDSEHMSDSVPVKYGYAVEIYKTLDIFYAMTKRTTNSRLKIMRWYIEKLNKNNSSKMRRDLVELLLKKEMSDSTNNETMKKKIKKDIEELSKVRAKNEESFYNPNWQNVSNVLLEQMFLQEEKKLSKISVEEGFEIIEENNENDLEQYRISLNENFDLNESISTIFSTKHTLLPVTLTKAAKIMSSKTVIEKTSKLYSKGWNCVKIEEELNPIQRKVILNKCQELTKKYKTVGVGGDVDINKVNIGAGISKTHEELNNIVLLTIQNKLCIVEATDNGNITSITVIYANNNGKLKFVRYLKSIF